MIKYNNSNINDWNYGDNNIIKVYRNGAVVFYKFDSEQGGFKVCYAVVEDITQYQETEFEDVYDKETEKWYKLNNLNQYEEYGVYGSGRNITYYNGKLTIDDDYEYEWSGSSWVNLGEVSSGTVVPQGYTEVEYIENTGTSYINTNFTPNQDTRLLADIQVVTYNSYGRLFGAGNHDIANSISCDYGSNGSPFEVSWGGIAGWTQYASEANYNKRTYDWNKNYLYVDGNLIGSSTYTTFTCQNKLGIFNVLENGDVPTSNTGRYFYGRVYNFKIYNNSLLVRDFVPVKRNSDNKYGMYDIVNDVFYVSPNNANFIGGAETGTTEYPKYYEEKSEPLDNLTFNTMEDAINYAYNNCVYDGMKATIDGNKYYFDSTDENGWVAEISYTIWLDPSATNALFSVGHYWGENYKIVFTMYLSGSYSGDYGSFWQVNGHSPIELSFYSNGFYYDMHNPTSTTAPDVRTTDYDYRILRQSAFRNYQNSQKIKITLTYGSFKAELEETGANIYSSGSTRTGFSWYDGLYQANVGINNGYSTCHLSHIEVYNANNELVNDLKFIKNRGVVGAQEISLYDSITKTTYNNVTSNTPVYHIET